ncbi:Nucleotide-binding universal stress protein, UspA family [Halobiforma haloterrestris]|uniref:Nucleotide-binding universal stress protein, UspA family n=1 Tax=Natronobacterium haloterrestre TaxID=148448 RepID=A0A1I1FD73_NATHA|nr:universal stress protein [Halobiforma haloterrestris]SFB97429.1 Nucleotide-binding universal stress protein, UspA family [Halobiforma haloterrestris]
MARVLVPFDDSDPARDALEYSFDLFPRGEFVALTVVDTSAVPFIPNSSTDDETDDRLEELLGEASERLETAEAIATDRDRPLETDVAIGSPAQEIIEYAEESDFDHVVMGSHGRSGVTRILLGSVAEVVVRHSSVPVTVVR